MEIDEGKPGGTALVACALAGVTRKMGVQASAPAAAALARKSRRDGLPARSAARPAARPIPPPAGPPAGEVSSLARALSRSWRGSIGPPRYMNRTPLKPHPQSGESFRKPSIRLLGS